MNELISNKWLEIEKMNWYDLSNNKNDNPNDALGEFLLKNYSKDEISELKNFVVEKRIQMKKFIINWLNDQKINLYLSDDTSWDLASHIVGLGYTMYRYVFDYPEILKILSQHYVENFEYGFEKALYEKNDYDNTITPNDDNDEEIE